MSELGSAYLAIIPKADKAAMTCAVSEIKSELGAAGESAGETSGKGFGSWFQSAAGVFVGNIATQLAATAADTVKQLFSMAYDGYAEYQQLIGGMDTLYGESSAQMQRYAAEAYSDMQMSANDYMDLATSFAASLVSSLGGDTAAAATYANTAIGDMADNANKMGTSMEDIENAYKGFSKQNYTMLDNLKLGYGGTQAEMKRLLEDAQKLKAANGETVEYSIDSFADMVDAIHVVQKNMGITGTSSEEASTTIQGSTAMMAAAWNNFLVSLGTGDFEPITTNFAAAIESTKVMLGHALPTIGTIITSALTVIGEELYEACPEQVQGIIDSVAPIVMTIVDTVTETGENVIAVVGPIVDDVVTFAMELYDELSPIIATTMETVSSGMDTVSAVIGVALDLIGTLWDEFWPVFKETMSGIIDALAPIVESGLSLVQSVLDTVTALIKGDWSGVWDGIKNILQNVWNLIGSIVSGAINGVKSVITGVMDGIKAAWDTYWTVLGNVVSSALDGIKSAVSGGLDGVLGFFRDLPGNIMGAVGNLGGLLWDAGSSIVSGLLSGIKDSIGSVYDFVGGIADKIASLKGPIPYDLKLLVPNGKAIMSGLEGGLEDGFAPVQDLVSGMADDLAVSFGSPVLSVETAGANTPLVNGVAVAAAQQTESSSPLIDYLKSTIAILEAIEQKDGNVYLDGNKVSVGLAAVSTTAARGRGLAWT